MMCIDLSVSLITIFIADDVYWLSVSLITIITAADGY